jgi:signal transduction histidine kinase
VFETRRPARIEDDEELEDRCAVAGRPAGLHSTVAAPIIVEGHLWGVVGVASTSGRPLPPDTEARLAKFTELVATAIANTESREELTRLAEEQAALRRVATLVANGAQPAEVSQAVIDEVGQVIGADAAALFHFESDRIATMASTWSMSGPSLPVGTQLPIEKGTAARLIVETRRPARINSYDGVPGATVALARELGWRSAVAAPVIVDGRLWGMAIVYSTSDRLLPPDTEERLLQFTDVVATAIANADSRAQLDLSRSRIVATADATRRRIERDLHDGAQQQLVSLALQLRAAQAMVPTELSEHRAELSNVVEGLTGVLDDLREIALGIHPAVLADGGLAPALKTLARRSPLPVELDVRVDGRLSEQVEVAAYYVVSEALTNAAKYARASVVLVDVEQRNRMLCVIVQDDGRGGADPERGSGLIGLQDRAEAIGGTISLVSPEGNGTSLRVELPLDVHT